MKTFLLLLFFSKTILLTPSPITLTNEWKELVPEKPLTAITGGAAIYIDVTSHLEATAGFEEIKKRFPDGAIQGKLITKKGKEIEIKNTASAHSKKNIRLIVASDKPLPTDVEFTKVTLRSNQEIKNVKVYWQNSKH